jgi:hypothetical protein
MPVQATLLHVSCAPPRDKFEQRGQPSCDAVPSVGVGGPEEPALGGARLTLAGMGQGERSGVAKRSSVDEGVWRTPVNLAGDGKR